MMENDERFTFPVCFQSWNLLLLFLREVAGYEIKKCLLLSVVIVKYQALAAGKQGVSEM